MSKRPKPKGPRTAPKRAASPAKPRAQSGATRPTNPMDPALGSAAIHAPWRLEYLQSLDAKEKAGDRAPTSAPAPAPAESGATFLLDYWRNPARDQHNHVIVRTAPADEDPTDPIGGMILLNAFPYANGHLLVSLGDARPTLLDYTARQRASLWRLTDAATALMQSALEPQGINIGINQGRAAGAGVPGHLHVHLVPRWAGDVNFISVVGRVRVIPSSLESMAETYRRAWARIGPTLVL